MDKKYKQTELVLVSVTKQIQCFKNIKKKKYIQQKCIQKKKKRTCVLFTKYSWKARLSVRAAIILGSFR